VPPTEVAKPGLSKGGMSFDNKSNRPPPSQSEKTSPFANRPVARRGEQKAMLRAAEIGNAVCLMTSS
jgi:hypothetical protein